MDQTEQVITTALSGIHSIHFCLDSLPRHADFDTRLAIRAAINSVKSAHEYLLTAQECLQLNSAAATDEQT